MKQILIIVFLLVSIGVKAQKVLLTKTNGDTSSVYITNYTDMFVYYYNLNDPKAKIKTIAKDRIAKTEYLQKDSVTGLGIKIHSDSTHVKEIDGYHLIKAGKYYNGSILVFAIGTGLGIGLTAISGDPLPGTVIMGVSAIIGLVFRIKGNNELIKQGELMNK